MARGRFMEGRAELGADRLGQADVGDDPLPEEGVRPARPVEELVRQNDVARRNVLAEGADGVDRDDALDT